MPPAYFRWLTNITQSSSFTASVPNNEIATYIPILCYEAKAAIDI